MLGATAGVPADWSETSVLLVMSQARAMLVCNAEHPYKSQQTTNAQTLNQLDRFHLTVTSHPALIVYLLCSFSNSFKLNWSCMLLMWLETLLV